MNKKQLFIIIGLVMISMVALAGTTYAVFNKTLTGNKTVSIQTGTLKVTFTDGNFINLNAEAPVNDSVGVTKTPYTFTIKNTGDFDAYYTILLEEEIANTLPNNYVKANLQATGYNSGNLKVSELDAHQTLLSERKLAKGASITYSLRLWIDHDADNSIQGKTYKSKIVVYSSNINTTTTTQ